MIKQIKVFSILFFVSFTLSLSAQDSEPEKPATEPPKLKSNFTYAGYSALLPGLGQVKKDRLYTGIFIFSTFAFGVYNWKTNLDNFYKEEKKYQETTWLIYNLNTVNSIVGQSNSVFLFNIIATQAFVPYLEAQNTTNTALQYVGLIYLFQIVHAYFCSPGSEFSSDSTSNASVQSRFNFNIYPTKNQFGQLGTNVDLNYTWRF